MLLQRGTEVGFTTLDEGRIDCHLVTQRVEERGFQTAERVVETLHSRLCEFDRIGIALGCQTVNYGTTGVGQTHHFGALVECLARSVVDCARTARRTCLWRR